MGLVWKEMGHMRDSLEDVLLEGFIPFLVINKMYRESLMLAREDGDGTTEAMRRDADVRHQIADGAE
jgi:hypothetical protein